MRTIRIFFGLTIILAACVVQSSDIPQDFQVVLNWNTGALPPQYTYSYTVAIGPGVQGSLEYQPDYGDEGAAYHWEEKFSLSQQDLDDLYATLQELGLLRHEWELGEIAEGSPGSSLVITVSGEEYHIPSISQLSHEEIKNVETAIEVMRIAVPQEIWDEMNSRQEEYEMNYEEK